MKSKLPDPLIIVDELYAAAMDTERYDTLLHTWSQAIEKSTNVEADFEDLLTSHLQHAGQLLEIQSDDIGNCPDDSISRVISVNPGNLITSMDSSAFFLTGLEVNGSLAAWNLTATSKTRLENSLQLARDGLAQIVVLRSESGQNLLATITEDPQVAKAGSLSIDIRQFVNSNQINAFLSSIFNLTPSEVDILELILNGQTPREIADARGKKLPTVRSQIKSLLEKTSTNSQVELIRMTTGLAASLSAFESETHQSGDRDDQLNLRCEHRRIINSCDGRSIEYSIFGPSQGRSALYFHDEFFGDGFTPEFIRELSENDIRLICIFRPGYGNTSPAARSKQYPDTFRSDVELVLREENITSSLVVLARGVGFFCAVELASDNSIPIRSIVGVRPALPWGQERDIEDAPRYTRLAVRMSKSAPKTFEFIAKAGYKHFLKFGAKSFVQKYYLSASSDMEAIEKRSDILDALSEGAEHALKRGTGGLGKDFVASKQDWRTMLSSLSASITLVVGEDDPTSRLRRARHLSSACENIHVEIASKTGHLVFYTHPRVVLAAMSETLQSKTAQIF